MTKDATNNLIIAGLVGVSITFMVLYIRGRKVFNRSLAGDVIDKYVGKKIIDRNNENQDTYLFAWWYAISKGQGTFFHGGNVFSTKTGTYLPSQ